MQVKLIKLEGNVLIYGKFEMLYKRESKTNHTLIAIIYEEIFKYSIAQSKRSTI